MRHRICVVVCYNFWHFLELVHGIKVSIFYDCIITACINCRSCPSIVLDILHLLADHAVLIAREARCLWLLPYALWNWWQSSEALVNRQVDRQYLWTLQIFHWRGRLAKWRVFVRRPIRRSFNISGQVELSGPYIDVFFSHRFFFRKFLSRIIGTLFFDFQIFLLLLDCRIDGIIVGKCIKTLTLNCILNFNELFWLLFLWFRSPSTNLYLLNHKRLIDIINSILSHGVLQRLLRAAQLFVVWGLIGIWGRCPAPLGSMTGLDLLLLHLHHSSLLSLYKLLLFGFLAHKCVLECLLVQRLDDFVVVRDLRFGLWGLSVHKVLPDDTMKLIVLGI